MVNNNISVGATLIFCAYISFGAPLNSDRDASCSFGTDECLALEKDFVDEDPGLDLRQLHFNQKKIELQKNFSPGGRRKDRTEDENKLAAISLTEDDSHLAPKSGGQSIHRYDTEIIVRSGVNINWIMDHLIEFSMVVLVATSVALIGIKEALLAMGHNHSIGTVPRVQAGYIIVMCLWSVDTSIQIPTSYDLAATHGSGEIESGLLLGAPYLLMALGSILVKYLLTPWCQPIARKLAIYCMLVIAVMELGFAALLQFVLRSDRLAMWIACEIRVVIGFIQGVFLLFVILATKVTAQQNLVYLTIGAVAATNAGVCCGPLLNSATNVLHMQIHGPTEANTKSAMPMYPLAALWALTALFFSHVMPLDIADLIPETSATPSTHLEDNMSKITEPEREIIVRCALLYSFQRAFTVSAIEVVTALILETEFQWSSETIGFGIGMIFAATVMVAFSLSWALFKGYSQRSSVLILLPIIGACGVVGLFKWPVHTPALIFLADAVAYSCADNADGVVEAYAVRAALPDTWYSMESYMVAKIWIVQLGRAIAPVVARWSVAASGRNCYAAAQCSLALCGCITLCKIHAIMVSHSLPYETL